MTVFLISHQKFDNDSDLFVNLGSPPTLYKSNVVLDKSDDMRLQ